MPTPQSIFIATFKQLLSHQPAVRLHWLAYLRAQLRDGGPAVLVPPGDGPALDALEHALPDDPQARFHALVAVLMDAAPSICAGDAWAWMRVEQSLMELTDRVRRETIRDPLRLSGPGRPKGSHDKSDVELYGRMARSIEFLRWKHRKITVETLAGAMGWENIRRVNGSLRRLGFKNFTDFKEHVLGEFPGVFLYVSELVVLKPRNTRPEGA